MRFSVVVPVYNVAEYLESCTNSVLHSDYRDFEMILVDDGSTDGVCPDLCDAIAQKNPDTVRVIHQLNMGLGGARNTGLEQARGDYLLFLDSDDTLAPGTLSLLSQRIEETHADIYTFQCCTHDGVGAKTFHAVSEVWDDVFSLEERPEYLLSLPAAWARIYRRELFLSTGIRYPGRVWYEDIRTTTKLAACAGSIVTLPDPLYLYLQRPGSIMNSLTLERNREILEAFEDIRTWFAEQNLYGTYEKELSQLALEHILLAGSVRVARQDPKHPLLEEFSRYVQEKFPYALPAPYPHRLSKPQKLLLWLIGREHYSAVNLLFRLRKR